jgi:hypothetical protein
MLLRVVALLHVALSAIFSTRCDEPFNPTVG